MEQGAIRPCSSWWRCTVLSLIAGFSLPAVAQIYVASVVSDTVGKYNLDGTPINATLITGLNNPRELAISGSVLYVASDNGGGQGLIGSYQLDGTPLNASLITTPALVMSMAVSGTSIFVGLNGLGIPNYGVVVHYSTSGTTAAANFIPTLGNGSGFATGIAVSGTTMFISVSWNGNHQVAKYDTDGTLVNGYFITGIGPAGFNHPMGIATAGNDLFVSDTGSEIERYTTVGAPVSSFGYPHSDIAIYNGKLYLTHGSAGTVVKGNLDGPVINEHLITGLVSPYAIAIGPYVLTPIESWRDTHFGIMSNSGNAADNFDFDKDGLVNLLEFAFGLNPKLGSSVQLPQGQRIGNDFVISFPTPVGVGGITYGAEWSSTLLPLSWTAISNTGTPPLNTFSVPIGSNSGMFVRLKVTRP